MKNIWVAKTINLIFFKMKRYNQKYLSLLIINYSQWAEMDWQLNARGVCQFFFVYFFYYLFSFHFKLEVVDLRLVLNLFFFYFFYHFFNPIILCFLNIEKYYGFFFLKNLELLYFD